MADVIDYGEVKFGVRNESVTCSAQTFLMKADREEAYKTLTGFLGIGPKVANCICLFGLHFTEAFPRDTWISRIEENHYHGHFPVHKYPGTAGIMQQYMFYYERMQQGKI